MAARSLPLRMLRALWIAPPVHKVRHEVNKAIEARRRAAHLHAAVRGLGQELRPGPVVVSGFHNEALGIGRAGRLTADGLEAAGFEVIRHDIRPILIPDGPRRAAALPGEGGVWLMHCNAPEGLLLFDHLREADLTGRYRIGYWAWELPRAPDDWIAAARFFDEIWTPSPFTTEGLKGCGKPVRTMPHPILAAETTASARRFYDAGPVNFLAMADLRSSAARKNPAGAIEAFKRAFPKAQAQAVLTVKIVQAGVDPTAMRAFQAAAAERSDIRFLTEELSGPDVAALVEGADVMLSLHRAEGFGLTLAEALAAGRAALATGWSGNMAFMQDLPEALLPYSLIPVEDATGIYGGQAWADPDLDAAAQAIRRLTNDADLRRRIGAAGRAAIEAIGHRWTREALADSGISRWSPPGGGAVQG